MDEQVVEAEVPTVGQQLRAAREESGLSLEDVAAQTRIPQRHLESLEESAWDRLPAPTYTTGFAKSYATAVGLDRTIIGEQLRAEMGGQRAATAPVPEVFEAADPARSMPKWLIIGAVIAVIAIVLLMSWLNERSLSDDAAPANEVATETPAPPPLEAAPPVANAQGPVVLTATGPAWIQVTDQGKILFSGELQPGQTYAVPATATAPLLKAGKPESLRITVGNMTAPAIGPAGKVAANVSLLGADLMRSGATPPAPPTTAAPPSVAAAPPARARPRATTRPVASPPAAAPPPAQAPAPESNTAAQ